MCLKEVELCAEYVNHFKFDSQHNWGDLYDRLMSMKIFALKLNKMIM